MPDIDTSPAALRALADYWGSSEPLGLDPRDGSLAEQLLAETERRMTQIVATLRALAAEKEATTKPHDPNRAGIAQATAMARNDIRRAFDRDEITAEDYRRMNDELDKSAGIVRAAPKPPMSAAEKEAPSAAIDAVLRDAMASGIGIARIAPEEFFARAAEKEAATVKPDLTVGAILAFDAASRDAHLEIVREKDATIDALRASLAQAQSDTRMHKYCVNAMLRETEDLRASLAAAEKERDEADASANKWMAQALAELGARGRVETSLSVPAETAAQLLERAEKAEAERDALAGPLVYRSYACTREHAVECAYLLSLVEAEYLRDPLCNAAIVIELCARGDVTMSEAIDALDAPVRSEDPAHD